MSRSPLRRRARKTSPATPRRARHARLFETLEARNLLAGDWKNPLLATDVNDDGIATPVDAITLITRLRLEGPGPVPASPTVPPPYYDTDGNDEITPLDAVIVINALFRDTGAPTVAAQLARDTAPRGLNDDGLTNDSTLAGSVADQLTGVAKLTAAVNGAEPVEVAFARNGQFSFHPGTLADGAHAVRFVAEDARGNLSSFFDVFFTLDTTPPAAPAAPALLAASDSGVRNDDGLTNDTTPTFRAEAATGSLLVLFAGDTEVGTGTANSPADITSTPLADGSFAITARTIDPAGNLGPASAAFSLVVDTAGPTVATDLAGTLTRSFTSFDVTFSEAMADAAYAPGSYAVQVVGGPNDGQMRTIASVGAFPNTAFVNLVDPLPDQDYRVTVANTLTDLAGNALAGPNSATFALADPPGIASISPANGETEVGVTRETIVRFDEPVDPDTVNDASLFLIAKGQRVTGRLAVSSTERFATFFYDPPLPPSTEVRIVVDGNLIQGRDGRFLDADGDDLPGGMATADFATLPLTRIPGTELFGYVYDAANVLPRETLPIPVPTGDPLFDPASTGTKTIPFTRAQFIPGTGTSLANPRQFVNQVTSFIDASMVYGSDERRARALRKLDGTGELKTSAGDHLPIDDPATFPDGPLEMANEGPMPNSMLPVAGDVRAAEVPTLSAMHTLWVREHNRYVRELHAANPQLSDEELYQAGRRWVGALIQQITYQEFLPAILGPNPLPAYAGYDPDIDPGISALFSTAAFRVGHTLQSGSIQRLDAEGNSLPGGPLSIRDAFFNPNPLRQDGLDAYLRGMAAGTAQEFDTQIIDDLRNFLFGPPGAGGLDLASINIQRGRDLGLPGYNQARADRGLPRVTSFAEITANATVAAALETVYGDVDKIDVWVGGLAEDHVAGGIVGPLFAAILRDQFTRSRAGDRFWYENGQFGADDLAAIRATTLTAVIERNSGVTGLPANVFTKGTVNAGSGTGGSAGTATETRSYDGYGNNETNEHLGETNWPLRVDYTVSFGDGISSPAGADRPNPRAISNALVAQSGSTVNSAGLTDIAVTWGQFLDHDLDLTPSQTRAGTNVPVVGATIRVDAFPEANAVTDAHGFFQLEDMPAPEFFVHIDGTTATTAPAGMMYPSVGKPFHTIPGQRTQLTMAGMPFNVYLPPMATADIQPLSATQPTEVGFGEAGMDELERMFPAIDSDEWKKVKVNFAPGAAVDEDGNVATTAVVIPVPPDRLPAPLAPGANPQLVISIQAPGATNFDVPASITFPNLDNLPLGAHATLFSFDHDVGKFVPVGTLEVVDDGHGGTILVSNEGVGIVAPGWHYISDPLNWSGAGGKPEGNVRVIQDNAPEIEVRLFVTGDTDTLSFTFTPPPGPGQRVGDHPAPGGDKEPTREVSIEIAGPFGDFYDNTGPNGLRPTGAPIVLRPGDASITRTATLRSLTQLLDHVNAGRPLDQDRVYGAQIKVKETVTLADGSRIANTRIIVPYLYVDQGDDNGADKTLKFRNTVHTGDFFAARTYDLRTFGAPLPFFEFSGNASDYADRSVDGKLAIRFQPTAVGARATQMTVRATVNGQEHVSPKTVSLLGTATSGTVIHLNKMDAVDIMKRQGKMEADAIDIYDKIKQHLESIIVDLGVAAQTAVIVDDADMGGGRAVNVLWNFANNEFIDRNGNGQLDNPEIDDRDNDGVFGETGGDFIDFNRDGIADVRVDANRDGMPDDVNGDGMVTAGDFVDVNGDGALDAGEYVDSDGDGNATVAELGDIDGDGRRGETRGEYIDFNRNGRPDAGEFDAANPANIDGNGMVDVAGDYIDYNDNTRFDTERLLGRAFTGVDFVTAEFGDKLVTNVARYGRSQQAYIFDSLFDRGEAGSFELMIDNIVGMRSNADAGVYGGITVAHEAFHTFGMVHSDNMGLGNFDIQNHTNPPANRLTDGSRFAMRAALDLTVHISELVDTSIRAFRQGYNQRNSDPPAFPLFSEPVYFEGPSFAALTTAGVPLHEAIDLGSATSDGVGGSLRTLDLLLQNPGDEPLVISGAVFATGGQGFALSGFTLGLTIPPNDERTVTLSFDPQAIGFFTDTLTFSTNATGSTDDDGHFNPFSDSAPDDFDDPRATPPDGKFRFALTGRGLDPNPVVEFVLAHEANNNFGGASLGRPTTIDDFITITNQGASPLTFAPTVVQGRADFSLGAFDNAPQTVASGASLQLPVTFRPSKLGLLPGLVRLTTNDPTRPIVEQGFVGTGIPADGIGPTDFDWGRDYVHATNGPAIHRALSDAAGFFQFGLGVDSDYTIAVFDPVSGYLAQGAGTTGPSGAFTDITRGLAFGADTSPDTDFDGLPDAIETTIGTSSTRRDTDGDGVPDFAEIQQGLDPLSGLRLPTGVLANLTLPGRVEEIAPAGNRLYVATGTHGLAIVDGTRFDRPVLQGQIDLPGTATGVGVDARLRIAAVATGALQLVDVSDPMMPRRTTTVPIVADRVVVYDGVAYATGGDRLHAVDLVSGEILQAIELPGSGTVTGLAREGIALYAFVSGSDTLSVIDIAYEGRAEVVGQTTVSIASFDVGLFAGNGVVWLAGSGLNSVDVTNPRQPTRIHGPDSFFSARRIALNGSGLGLLAPDGFPSRFELFDLSDPTATNAKLNEYTVPGPPVSVAISRGLAYAGNSTFSNHRLDVINYLPLDTLDRPPTVTISSPVPDLDPNRPGVQVLEGTTIPVRVDADDDVQVQRVELLSDGVQQLDDVAFPFDFVTQAPLIAVGGSEVRLEVRATDTGGNAAVSAPLTIEVVPDTFPPHVTLVSPGNGETRGEALRTVRVTFDESMNPATLTSQNVFVTRVDAPTVPLVPTNVQVRNDDRLIQLTFANFAAGEYRVTLHSAAIRDRAGNPLGAADQTTRFDVLASTAIWSNPLGGIWNDPANWESGVLPTPSDRVLIRVPDDVVITHPTGNTHVVSITSTNRFRLTGGSLTVDDFLEIRNEFTISGSPTLVGGTVRGGPAMPRVVVDPFAFLTLDGVRFDNDLLVRNGAFATVRNDLTLNGTATLDSEFGTTTLQFNGTQTLGGTGGVRLSGSSVSNLSMTNGTLTIGPQIEVTATTTSTVGGPGATLVNQGVLIVDSLGERLSVEGDVTNEGTFEARRGLLSSEPVTNFAAGTLTGGVWQAGNDGILIVEGATITTNAADVRLHGPNAQFLHDSNNSAFSGLTTNAAGGALRIFDGRAFAVPGGFRNDGLIALDGISAVTVGGAFVQSANGVLETGVSSALQLGQLHATGAATLDGTLRFVVPVGTGLDLASLTPVTFASRTGTFSAVTGLPVVPVSQVRHEATHVAVVFGASFAGSAPVPYANTFASANQLGAGMLIRGTPGSQVRVSGDSPRTPSFAALLSSMTESPATSELLLQLDLAGQSDLQLSFYHLNAGDTGEMLPTMFVGSVPGDGVAISTDGVTWHRVVDLSTAAPATSYTHFLVDLDAAATAAGLTLGDDLAIKFQRTGPVTQTGRRFDDIRVAADAVGPRITSITPPAGFLFEPSVAQLVALFDEPIVAASATNAANYLLRRPGTDGLFGTMDDVNVAVTPQFDGDRTVTLVPAAPLGPGSYQLTTHGSTSIVDAAGNKLNDGLDDVRRFEIVAPESPTNDTRVTATDTGIAPPEDGFATSAAIEPRVAGNDVDLYRVEGGAGLLLRATATSVVVPGIASQPNLRVRLLDSNGDELASDDPAASLSASVAQLLSAAGTYFIEVTAPDVGRYDLSVEMGGALGTFPFTEDFETPPLPPFWSQHTTGSGRITVTDEFHPAEGMRHLVLDSATTDVSRSEAVLHVNLAGQTNVELQFRVASFDFQQNVNSLPASFAGSVDGTGVAVSADGVNWRNPFVGQSSFEIVEAAHHGFPVRLDLDEVAAAAGLPLTAEFFIKFQFTGGGSAPDHGIAIDDVRLLADRVGPTIAGVNPIEVVPVSQPSDVAVGDVNLDGLADIVVALDGYGGDIVVMYNDPDDQDPGDQFDSLRFGLSGGARSVALADLDGTSGPDVIYTRAGNFLNFDSTVSVMLNDGTGHFGPREEIDLPFLPIDLRLGSFDLLPGTDLLLGHDTTNFSGTPGFSILSGNGTGGFLPTPTNVQTPYDVLALAAGELTGDPFRDIVVVGDTGVVQVFVGTPGAPNPGLIVDVPGATDAAIADVNGDARPDLVIAAASSSGGVIVVLTNSPVGFGMPVSFPIPFAPRSLLPCSLNGDTAIDLAVSNVDGTGSSTLTLLLNDGTGGFSSVLTAPAGDAPDKLAAGLLDSNGTTDLVTVSLNERFAGRDFTGEVSGNVTVLHNDGMVDANGLLAVKSTSVFQERAIPLGALGIGSFFDIYYDEAGELNEATVLDPANYSILSAGPDAAFDLPNDPAPDDVPIAIGTPTIEMLQFGGGEFVRVPVGTSFAPLGPGLYRLTAKGTATIRDAEGNPLNDLDGDGTGADSVIEIRLFPHGLYVTSPNSLTTAAPLSEIVLTFSAPLDAATFTVADVPTIFTPNGTVPVTEVVVSGATATVRFPSQSEPGPYFLFIGADIADTAGNRLNRDFDDVFGEPDDGASVFVSVTGSGAGGGGIGGGGIGGGGIGGGIGGGVTPLHAASPAAVPTNDLLDADTLQATFDAALAGWISAGLTAAQADLLDSTRLVLADLPGTHLALAGANTIYVDATAAGWGWFADSTPDDDTDLPPDRVDLLTALSHELGHLLGHGHSAGDELLAPTLRPGVRHRPWSELVDDLWSEV